MKSYDVYEIKLSCSVNDKKRLRKLAESRYRVESPSVTRADVVQTLGTRRDPDLGACLQMLLDPGFVDTSFSIDQSSSECVTAGGLTFTRT